MVQSIFDDEDNRVMPANAGPVPSARHDIDDDDPFGFGDLAPAPPPRVPAPAPVRQPQPPAAEPAQELPSQDRMLSLPPAEARHEPPPTQLDGQQRSEPVYAE